MWPVYVVQPDDNSRQFEAPHVGSDHHLSCCFGCGVGIRWSKKAVLFKISSCGFNFAVDLGHCISAPLEWVFEQPYLVGRDMVEALDQASSSNRSLEQNMST